ncbi:MAG: hypothetical protein ACFE9S_03570 [Candidatus Hermodarchaeota archaeon]
MGKEAQSQAKKLGMMSKPQYTFYYSPRKVKAKFSKIKPDVAYLIEDWIKQVDASAIVSEAATGGRSAKFYYFAPQANVYVEILDKISGYVAYSTDNHVNKIDIYTDNQDYVKAIVQGINNIWEDGLINNLRYKKLRSKFKVSEEDIANAWKSFL